METVGTVATIMAIIVQWWYLHKGHTKLANRLTTLNTKITTAQSTEYNTNNFYLNPFIPSPITQSTSD